MIRLRNRFAGKRTVFDLIAFENRDVLEEVGEDSGRHEPSETSPNDYGVLTQNLGHDRPSMISPPSSHPRSCLAAPRAVTPHQSPSKRKVLLRAVNSIGCTPPSLSDLRR